MMPSGILIGACFFGLILAGALTGLGIGLLGGRAASLQGTPRLLVTLGFAAFGVLLGAFIGIVQYSALRKRESEERQGWNLVPIVVAAVDIPAGETMIFAMISQRSVPEQFVNGDVVRPDAAMLVVNHRMAVALKAGDAVTWPSVCDVSPDPGRTP